jgi:hypothetical protein
MGIDGGTTDCHSLVISAEMDSLGRADAPGVIEIIAVRKTSWILTNASPALLVL